MSRQHGEMLSADVDRVCRMLNPWPGRDEPAVLRAGIWTITEIAFRAGRAEADKAELDDSLEVLRLHRR